MISFVIGLLFLIPICTFLVLVFDSLENGEPEKAIVYSILTILMIGLSVGVIVSVENHTPEKRNATLLQNIEKATKEYEKFLIDYPEFKMVEE